MKNKIKTFYYIFLKNTIRLLYLLVKEPIATLNYISEISLLDPLGFAWTDNYVISIISLLH